jgi:RimJ/RimL family protein N-acetyltransferase
MFECLPRDLGRVRLRRLRCGDLEDFRAHRGDPRVAEYQGWEPMGVAEAEAFVASQAGHADLVPGAWRQLGIADAANDRLIGDIGLWLSPDRSTIEFGISLRREAQGQDLGTDCVRGLIDLIVLATPVEAIVAHADIRNLACIAMLGKAGMAQVSRREVSCKGERCVELGFVAKRNAFAPGVR